jgi:hypothetical protein
MFICDIKSISQMISAEGLPPHSWRKSPPSVPKEKPRLDELGENGDMMGIQWATREGYTIYILLNIFVYIYIIH